MIRMILSVLIVALIVSYVVIPLIRPLRRFFRGQIRLIDQAFNGYEDKEKEEQKPSILIQGGGRKSGKDP